MKKVARASRNGQSQEGGTLFAGCDIGSATHAVAIMDQEGNILEKLGKVYNSRAGFRFLTAKLDHWAERTGADSISFGFEPTGHYWKPLIHHLKGHGVDVFFIKTTAVKAMRELTDSTPSKNDKRDAVTLTHILRENKVLKSPPPEGIWSELRSLGKYRETLREENTALLLKLRAWMDTFFPELAGAFSSIDAVSLRRLLEETPLPEDVIAKGIEWLTANLKRWMRKGKTAEEKAEMLMSAAMESIGVACIPRGPQAPCEHSEAS